MSNLKRISALFLAFIILATVFTGCSGKQPTADTAGTTEAPAATTTAGQEATDKAAEKPYAGTKVRFVVTRHNWTDQVLKIIDQFKEATGIEVNIEEVSPEDQLNNKLSVESAAGGKTLDAFMTRPLQEGIIFQKNGWYHPIGDFAEKDADYDVNDLFAGAREILTFDGKLYGIPLIAERFILYYRKDLFEAQGIKVPETLEELEAAAKKIQENNKGMVGIASRGQQSPAVTAFSNYLHGFGGDFIKDGKAVINSPESVKGFQFYGDLLRNYGPKGVVNMSWPEAAAVFSQGNAGMYTDADGIYNAVVDPEKSVIADKIGFAVFPAGPARQTPYNVCSWALGMGANSSNKEAAWELIKWLTSKDNSIHMLKSGITVARSSAWEDKEATAALPPQLVEVIVKSNQIGTGIDRPRVINVGEARDIVGSVIVAAIEGKNVQQAADKANADLQKLIDKEK